MSVPKEEEPYLMLSHMGLLGSLKKAVFLAKGMKK